jgi:hypothetical protein
MIMVEQSHPTAIDREKHHCNLSFIAVIEIAVEAISSRRLR